MKRTQDNHARGADDTAVIPAVTAKNGYEQMPGDHSPMAEHGLLAPIDHDLEDDREEGLAAELAKAAPKTWWNRGTLVLGAVALILAGFLGGAIVQKHYGTSATAAGGNRAGAGAGGFGGGRGTGAGSYAGGGFTGGGNAQGGGTGSGTGTGSAAAAAAATGTVKLVDGDTIYVQTANGDVVTVNTSGSTTIRTTTKGTVKSVKAGQSITVQGATGTDGTVTATSVTAGKK